MSYYDVLKIRTHALAKRFWVTKWTKIIITQVLLKNIQPVSAIASPNSGYASLTLQSKGNYKPIFTLNLIRRISSF
jgi:hypothetical protein